jgi:hypothetical protein
VTTFKASNIFEAAGKQAKSSKTAVQIELLSLKGNVECYAKTAFNVANL